MKRLLSLALALAVVVLAVPTFAGTTVSVPFEDKNKGCWVADAGGKTAHWKNPCPPVAGTPGTTSQLVRATPTPTPVAKTFEPRVTKTTSTTSVAKTAPMPALVPKTPATANQRAEDGSGDPLKGLNVTKPKGCWIANPKPHDDTANWTDPCPVAVTNLNSSRNNINN